MAVVARSRWAEMRCHGAGMKGAPSVRRPQLGCNFLAENRKVMFIAVAVVKLARGLDSAADRCGKTSPVYKALSPALVLQTNSKRVLILES